MRETLRIPLNAGTLEGFRRWSSSRSFPEKGRIDFLDGELEIDLSPEDIYLHGAVKTALAAALYDQVVETGRGGVYVDCTRVVSVSARLSVEPDVLAVLWESLASGRVREVPARSRQHGRFVEFEGAPDLVVEVVSDGSERKDRGALPPLYAAAGVPELWRVDVRGAGAAAAAAVGCDLGIHHLGPNGYEPAAVDAEGWSVSRLLGRPCRLQRRALPGSRAVYKLEIGPERG